MPPFMLRVGRWLTVLLLGSLLSACASRPQPLYYWGDYQGMLYSHFKGEKGPEEQIATLEKDVELARSRNLALPPGFQAHLALLYEQTGRGERMVEYLEAEKRQFPESSVYVDLLLKNKGPAPAAAKKKP